MESKLVTARDAIKRLVNDGDTVFLGGFVHNVPYAAAHEMIRQRKRNLVISKSSGDIMVDQLIGTGCVSKLITSYVWNPGPPPRSANAFRRAIEQGVPSSIQIEDYTVFSLTMAYLGGALGVPFMPIKSLFGSDLANRSSFMGRNKVREIHCPFTGERVLLVPSIKHDVGILQVQRADEQGNAQGWGIMGDSKYGIKSCKRVIICAEEIVETDVIHADPDRTIVPSLKVAAVIKEPWGAHPSYIQGYYDIDWDYWVEYHRATKTLDGFSKFMDEWVYSVKDRTEYLQKLGRDRLLRLSPESAFASPTNYGKYTRRWEGEI